MEAQVKNNTLSVIFSTRTHNQRHIDHLRKSSGLGKNIEIIEYINKGQYSLTELYNKGLKEAKNDIVVFCHDDILFNKNGWARRLLTHFNTTDYGILGTAGTTQLHESGKWWSDGKSPGLSPKMVGIVKHSHNGKTWENRYSGNFSEKIIETVIVDGLFFAVHKNRIKDGFSEDIKGFHFYEIDFTFSNHTLGVKVGVIFDIRITHKSIGETDEEWERNRINFVGKWHGLLPYEIHPTIFYEKKDYKFKHPPTVRLIIETYGNLLMCDNFLKSIKEKSTYENLEIWLIVNYDEIERYEILLKTNKNLNIRIIDNYSPTFIKFIEYNIEEITKEIDLVVFTHEEIELVNDTITNTVSLFNKKNNDIGSISCRLYDRMGTIFSCGQELYLNKENKIVFHHKGQNSFYNYEDGHYICPCGGKKEFIMVSSKILKIEDLFLNSDFKTYLWDLQLNLKLLNYNKKNYIDNNSVIKMTGDQYSVGGLHSSENYKKYLNHDMNLLTQYIQKDKNMFMKAVKLLK